MVASVMSVLGPVPADELGIVLPHEHVLLDALRLGRGRSYMNDVPLAIQELGCYKAAGGKTVVDMSNLGLGRNPKALQRIATETGVQIIMGCGWYYERYYEPRFFRQTTNEVADEMVRDLTTGVDGTGICAGIIGEIGSDCAHGGISPAAERSFRAAARAHKRTGVTISTHADYIPVGLAQLDLLEEEGVDPRRVVIGHCDSVPDPGYHEALAKRGAYVQFDAVRGVVEWDTQNQVEWVNLLIRKGYLRQILISHDVCNKVNLKAYGGNGFDYIPTVFATRLQSTGVSKDEIDVLLVDNPRAALVGEIR